MDDQKRMDLKKIDNFRFMIEKHDAMRVSGLIYIDAGLLKVLGTNESMKQVEDVAALSGIV